MQEIYIIIYFFNLFYYFWYSPIMKKLYAFRYHTRLASGKRGLPIIVFLEFEEIWAGTEFKNDYVRVPEFDIVYPNN